MRISCFSTAEKIRSNKWVVEISKLSETWNAKNFPKIKSVPLLAPVLWFTICLPCFAC